MFFNLISQLILRNITTKRSLSLLTGGIVIGGMYNNVTVSNCLFEENDGSYQGGGLLIFSSAEIKDLRVVDCIFERNTASVGSGFCLFGAVDTSSVWNCTFSSNKGASLEIDTTDNMRLKKPLPSVSIRNCQFYGNKNPSNGGGISL